MHSCTKRAMLLSLAAIAGCQQSSAGTSPPQATTAIKPPYSRQLIIKLKPGSIACDPAGIARLSAATQVPLEFVRTMSGGACVIKQLADDPDNFSQGQNALMQNPAVEYLEPDTMKKAK